MQSNLFYSHPVLYFLGQFISYAFGLLAFSIGMLNMFWGNDQGYGISIALLSFIYVPPFSRRLHKITGIEFPGWLKLLLAIFIVWSALGVAELPGKMALMREDLAIKPDLPVRVWPNPVYFI